MIPMNAFAREPEELRRRQIEAVERVFKSGWWVLGNEVKEFEFAWAKHCGTRHAIGVGNGMDALEIGLRALGIGNGDEVITTPMTAFATVLAIVRSGATPVLADICHKTGCLDPISIERCISPNTKAVLLVHLYGQAARIDEIQQLCTSRNLFFLEDAAQAHGAKWLEKSVGGLGVFAGWSFYPTKNLGCVGDGGAITTDSDDIAQKARSLRNYGQSVRYHHPIIGSNSRLDEIQAAILRVRLDCLPEWLEKRREVARAYHEGISNPCVTLMQTPKNQESHVFHLFVIRCKSRDQLSMFLREKGVESLIHYPLPIHHQEPMRSVRRDHMGLPVAEAHARECLSLPCHPFLSKEEFMQIIGAVNSFRE